MKMISLSLSLFLFLFILLPVEATSAKLLVYSSRKEHLIKDVFELYQKESGIEVSYLTGQAGALIQKLKEEGEETPADLLLTVDAGNLWYAAHEGLLQPFPSEFLQQHVPPHLRDPENRWFALSIRIRTLVYNTALLRPHHLSTYEDLASPKWGGKLCLRTSKKVYNQSLVAMLIHQHGREKAKQIVAGWAKNAVDIFPSDTLVLKAVASGQCQVGIVNSYYYGRLLKKDPHLPLKIFWPNQGERGYGTHINISGGGIVKNSKNVAQARRFLEWLMTSKAQRPLTDLNMEYPVNTDVRPNLEVLKWGPFKSNRDFPLHLAGILQKNAIMLMDEVGYN